MFKMANARVDKRADMMFGRPISSVQLVVLAKSRDKTCSELVALIKSYYSPQYC